MGPPWNSVVRERVPILGLIQTPMFGGRIVVFGDSGFADSSLTKGKVRLSAYNKEKACCSR